MTRMVWIALNPNTDTAMTDAVVAGLRPHAPPGTAVRGMTAREGCAVIDSRERFAIGAQSALGMLPGLPGEARAVLLACFGDPGLEALREACDRPVVGLAEAALLQAHAMARPYAIITAGADWVGMLAQRSQDYGAAHWLVDVLALPVNGAALRRDPAAFHAEVQRLSKRAADAGAETLILGGAAFAGLVFAVDARLTMLDVNRAAAEALAAAVDGRRKRHG